MVDPKGAPTLRKDESDLRSLDIDNLALIKVIERLVIERLESMSELFNLRFEGLEEKMDTQHESIEKKLDEYVKKQESNYVTKDQFYPVRLIAYGLVGLMTAGVMGGILAVVITNPGRVIGQ